ncbi:hypothetical protein A4G20_00355 [Pasteurellaceae bacterium RH1A]|nr:hypothetical protein A4G20_00355 [Pasteurellaceae bacterium RH1A]
MRKPIYLGLIFLLSACTMSMSDQDIRSQYAAYYAQDDKYVESFAKEINQYSVEELAQRAAKKDKARMPAKIGDNLFGKDVKAEKNIVVFEYELEKSWWGNLSQSKQNEIKQRMAKDLVYRTCSLRTVALSQDKGLEENHRYYTDYSNKKLAFELATNKQVCQLNGFRK